MSLIEVLILPNILMTIFAILVAVLAVKVMSLYKTHMTVDDCIKKILLFANQKLELLQKDRNTSNETICLYLIGAIEFLGTKHSLTKQQRQIVTIQILKHNLELTAKEISKYYAEATSFIKNDQQDSISLQGARAAKIWALTIDKSNKLPRSDYLDAFQLTPS